MASSRSRSSRSRSHDRSSSPPRRRRSRSHSSLRQGSSCRSHGRDTDPRGPRDRSEDNIDYKSAYLALKANEMIYQKKRKRGPGEKVQSVQGMGRPIRMLAALFGEIPLIITDAESYLVRGRYAEDDDIDEFTEDLTPKQEEYLADKRECERNLLAYEQIVRLVPALKQKLLEDAEELLPFYAVLQKGANDSRSDDFARVRFVAQLRACAEPPGASAT
ncbi:hypothetical protein K438DRAFT_1777079 [Mycena galopus ATCC 62051]|nr:hypothetical protein K438DRAFT_1777079 [Mycena galopus ATCC 62051]